MNLRHVVTPVVNAIRVLGVDRTVADSSAYERLEGSELKKGIWRESGSHVESVSPCRSLQESFGQIQGQEEGQGFSRQTMCELEQENAPLLCRLRMNLRDQDQPNIFLQDYRCVVTVIRQEDVGVDVHDKCSSLPCVCGSSCHMPRKEEGSAHKRTKPQTPAPKGATSSADERAKADKETQHVERGQAKLKALQHATDSAKAPTRSQDTASDTSTRQKTAKLTNKPASSTQASSSGIGDGGHLFPRRRLLFGRDLHNQRMLVHFHQPLRRVRHHNLQQQLFLNKQISQLRNPNHLKLNVNKGITQLRRCNHHSQKNQLSKELPVSRRG